MIYKHPRVVIPNLLDPEQMRTWLYWMKLDCYQTFSTTPIGNLFTSL